MSKRSVFHLSPQQFHRLLDLATGDPQIPPEGSAESPDAVEPASPSGEALGSWIGRYRLLRILGEGGMGIVYLAEQEHPLKRQVALKIIKPGMDSKRVIARFETERQALALLDHPSVAQVYDAGTTEAGRPYFVMEHVEGLPITDHCDKHRLSIEQRLRLFQQVCLAVHHAHQKGIIHRDLKPSNILVSGRNGQVTPKIIDFGVAKAMSQPLTERTLATQDSQLLGTPEYMSPEQADMAGEDIDTRSDIYSLGVLLYVLLTGALPFDSDTLRTGGIEHIRHVIRETDPRTPSTRVAKLGDEANKAADRRRTQVGTLARQLRRELEWIPLKAMRKDRAERYRSVAELADDIENYLTGAPLMAGPPTTGYRLQKFLRRHKALVGGTAAVLLISVVGTTVSVIFALGQSRARKEADAVSNFLRKDVLASVDPSRGNNREVTVRSVLDTASENLDGKFENEPLAEASIRDTLGWTYRMLGELEAAQPHLERALQIRQEEFGAEHMDTLSSMGRLGWLYCGQGRKREAENLWAKQLEISRRVLGEEHWMTLGAMNDLAIAYKDLGRYDEAVQLYLQALRTIGFPEEQQRQAHRFIGNLGQVYGEQGRYAEAEALYLKAIEMKRHELGEQHPYTLIFMEFLARVYRQQGRYAEAETLYLTTLDIQRRVLGNQHAYTLWSVKGLASVYADQARYKQAEELFDEAMEGWKTARGEEDRDIVDCMNGLAELDTILHRYADAESLLTKAEEISGRTLGDDHPWTLASKSNLALLRTKQEQYEQAERLFDEALKGRKRKLGEDHPHTLETLNDFGVLRREQERYEDAESLLRQALEGRQRKLGNDHPACFESMHELGVLYVQQARYEDAEPLLLQAFHGREAKLGPDHPHTLDSLKELVRLYESWPEPDEAKKYRAKLTEHEDVGEQK